LLISNSPEPPRKRHHHQEGSEQILPIVLPLWPLVGSQSVALFSGRFSKEFLCPVFVPKKTDLPLLQTLLPFFLLESLIRSLSLNHFLHFLFCYLPIKKTRKEKERVRGEILNFVAFFFFFFFFFEIYIFPFPEIVCNTRYSMLKRVLSFSWECVHETTVS
jgi:hypothetical protein